MTGLTRWAAAAAGAVTALVIAVVLLAAMVAGAVPQAIAAKPALNTAAVPAAYVSWVERAGAECAAVSPPQIAAQTQQESGWNKDAVSSADAQGLAQFLPRTWAVWGRADSPGPISPFNPGDALMAMGRYDCAIAVQVARVPGSQLANMLAGYNAGPQAVLQFGGVPPFAQTQQYVASIEQLIPRYELVLAAPPPPHSAFAAAEVIDAERWIGTPYVWGGGDQSGPTAGLASSGPAGFDCSGLVLYAVAQASGGRILLPHSSEIQATLGAAVSPRDIQPGDVIAIQEEPQTHPGDFSHIVIYIGGGEVIQAPHTGANVDIVALTDFAGLPQAIRRYG
jgi:cell wall-associated NlpC family hydrolase